MRRRPVSLGYHRVDDFFGVERLRRFGQDLDRGGDTAELLLHSGDCERFIARQT